MFHRRYLTGFKTQLVENFFSGLEERKLIFEGVYERNKLQTGNQR